MSFKLPKGFMGQVPWAEGLFVGTGTGVQKLLLKPRQQDARVPGCQAPERPCLALLI